MRRGTSSTSPSGSHHSSKTPKPQQLNIEQKYNHLFLENTRETIIEDYNYHINHIRFDFNGYEIWVSPDANGEYPDKEELEALKRRVKFFIEVKLEKTAIVYTDNVTLCQIITSIYPNILINSTIFYNLRSYSKGVFANAEHDFLYEHFLVDSYTVRRGRIGQGWQNGLLSVFNLITAYNLNLEDRQKTLLQEYKIPHIRVAAVHCHAQGRKPHAMTSCQVKLMPHTWRILTMVSRSLSWYRSVTE